MTPRRPLPLCGLMLMSGGYGVLKFAHQNTLYRAFVDARQIRSFRRKALVALQLRRL